MSSLKGDDTLSTLCCRPAWNCLRLMLLCSCPEEAGPPSNTDDVLATISATLPLLLLLLSLQCDNTSNVFTNTVLLHCLPLSAHHHFSTSYPEAAGPPSNTDDDLAIISATLPLLQDEAGNTPATARMLCTQTECSPVPSNPSLITTTVRAVISGADDRDYYNVTADAQTAGPQRLKVVITYEPNWSKRSLALNGSEFSQNWRISNLRLQLQFVQQAVEVVAGPATEWSTQQQFDVTLPEAGEGALTQQLDASAQH